MAASQILEDIVDIHKKEAEETRTTSQTNRVFLLSCIPQEQKKSFAKIIHQLGGCHFNSEVFKKNCTHVICGKLCRSEKILAACASGKWILKPQYIFDSLKAKKWLAEDEFEWSNDDGVESRFPTSLLIAPRRWRLNYLVTEAGSFSGWNVAVFVEKRSKQIVYNRLLTSGGASIFSIKLPITNSIKVASYLTYLFVDDKNASSVMHLLEYGVMCLRPEFIGDYLINFPTPDPVDYLVKIPEISPYGNKEDKPTGNTSDIELSSCLSSPLHHEDCFIVESPVSKNIHHNKYSLKSKDIIGSEYGSLPLTSITAGHPVNTECLSSKSLTSQNSTVRNTISLTGSRTIAVHVDGNLKVSKSFGVKHSGVQEVSKYISKRKAYQMKSINSRPQSDGKSPNASINRSAVSRSKDESAEVSETSTATHSASQSSPDTDLNSCSQKASVDQDCFIVETHCTTKFECNAQEQSQTVLSICSEKQNNKDCELFKVTHGRATETGDVTFSSKNESPLCGELKTLENSFNKRAPLLSSKSLDRVSATPGECVQCSFSPHADEREADRAYRKETPPTLIQNMATVKRKLIVEEDSTDELYHAAKRLKVCELNSWRPLTHILKSQRSDKKNSSRLQESNSGIIQAYLDESVTDYNVEFISGILNENHYPQSRSVNFLIMNLLSSNDTYLSQKLFNVLQKLLSRHPPSSPKMQQVYLSAFKVHTDSQQQHSLDDEWCFIDQLLRELIVDGQNTSEDSSSRHVDNKLLLLEFVVTLLEQDFKTFCSQNNKAENNLRLPMIAYLLFRPSLIVSVNKRMRDFTSYITDILKSSMQRQKKLNLMKLYFGIISMVAEYLHISGRAKNFLFPGLEALNVELTSIFINDIASKILAVDLDVGMVSTIFSLLRPAWLSLGVCQALLKSFGDYLVEQTPNSCQKQLSLDSMVSDYFYLLPTMRKKPDVEKGDDQKETRATMKSPCSETNSGNPVNGRMKNTSCGKGKHTASWMKRNPKGETPLHVACIKDDAVKLTSLLQIPGVDVNIRDYAGWTPLHEACNHGSLSCVKKLLEFVPTCCEKTNPASDSADVSACRKADLYACDPNKITPLHDAVINDKLEVCRLLLKYGGSGILSPKTILGYTALDLSKNNVMTELLLSYQNSDQLTFPQSELSEEQGKLLDSSLQCKSVNIPKDFKYEQVIGSNQMHADKEETKKYIFLIQTLINSYLIVTELFHFKESTVFTEKLTRFKRKTASESCSQTNSSEESQIHHIQKDLISLRNYPEKIVLFEKHLERILSESDFDSVQMNIYMLKCFIESVCGRTI